MKSEEYVKNMLKRAEAHKRRAFIEKDDQKFYTQNSIMRILKIVLDIERTTGKRKLQKIIKYNSNLIKTNKK